MIRITENDYNLRFPKLDGINLNNYDSTTKELFLELYSTYLNLFYKFLLKRTKIKEFDNNLENNAIPALDTSDYDSYQKASQEFLKYFYIRNNIHIERLTQDETKFLYSKIASENKELDEETETFISSTYQKMIYETLAVASDNLQINFGPNVITYYAPPDSLVIGVNYNQKINFSDQNAYENSFLRKDTVSTTSEVLQKELQSVFGEKVRVIMYNSSSVKTNTNSVQSNK